MKDSYTVIGESFTKVINAIRNFGYEVGYMKYVIDTKAHYSNGKVVQKEDNIWGSSWCENKVIYINPNYQEVLSYFHIEDMTVEYWYCFNIAYQLAKELYKNTWKEKDKADIYNRASNDKTFHSTFLDALSGSASSLINEETCCEYFAIMVCRSLGMI